jgi:hypothetical protein
MAKDCLKVIGLTRLRCTWTVGSATTSSLLGFLSRRGNSTVGMPRAAALTSTRTSRSKIAALRERVVPESYGLRATSACGSMPR